MRPFPDNSIDSRQGTAGRDDVRMQHQQSRGALSSSKGLHHAHHDLSSLRYLRRCQLRHPLVGGFWCSAFRHQSNFQQLRHLVPRPSGVQCDAFAEAGRTWQCRPQDRGCSRRYCDRRNRCNCRELCHHACRARGRTCGRGRLARGHLGQHGDRRGNGRADKRGSTEKKRRFLSKACDAVERWSPRECRKRMCPASKH
jgi:hypothetical protein